MNKYRLTKTMGQPASLFIFTGLIFISSLFLISGCERRPTELRSTTIAALKRLDPAMLDKIRLEQEYRIEGYFINETVPILLTDPMLLDINKPLPDSSYIILQGVGIDEFAKQESSYGCYIRLRGKLFIERLHEKEQFKIGMKCDSVPYVINKSKISKPHVYNICDQYPSICRIVKKIPKKFALLYSGGINSVNAHLRYWNDLKFMYLTLRNKYGYTDEHIVVVYKDGVGEDGDMTVDHAASPSGLNDAITYLRTSMSATDDFFLFVTNHGGGYEAATSTNYGGRLDSSPGDEIDTHKYDEAIYYYNQSSNSIWDDEFSNWINTLNYNRMFSIFEPCFSGGFIHDMKDCKRIIISAASEFEFSWGGAPANHDMFSYHFTCALNNADHTGASLNPNPDTNGDGSVSILEAFLYAKSKDTANETPFLEDNGDGIGTNSPSATATDGSLANTTKL